MLLLLGVVITIQATESIRNGLHCGQMVRITATADEGYHFVCWSDGNTDNPRLVDVTESTSWTAVFEPDCDVPDIPIVQAYDWILMLNVDSLHAAGLVFQEEQVSWYRIVDDTGQNDQFITSGYFMTIETPLAGTGDYYALLDLTTTPGLPPCAEHVKSQVVHYSTHESLTPERQFTLHPTKAKSGTLLRLDGLLPQVETTIDVFTMSGKHVRTITSHGESTLFIQAEWQPGWYMIHINDSTLSGTLKYVSIQ